MRIRLNGRETEVADDVTLGQLVDAHVPNRRGVAAARDGEVISRSAWDDTPLGPDAEVEIVAAVQGG